MGNPLTPELVLSRAKVDNLSVVKKINLWGSNIDDVKLLNQMPNAEVLSLSVNKIASLRDFAACPMLQELYLRKNLISSLSEVRYLVNLQHLKILWLWDNPCCETPNYREYIIKLLPNLLTLDNKDITSEERRDVAKLNIDLSDLNTNYKQQDSQSKDMNKNNILEYQSQRSSNYDDRVEGPNIEEEENKQTNTPKQEERDKILGREFQREYSSDKAKYDTPSLSLNNENLILAIVTLMKELDEKGLTSLKEDIEKKLSTLRNRKKE